MSVLNQNFFSLIYHERRKRSKIRIGYSKKLISSLADESPIEFVVPSLEIEHLVLAHTISSSKVGIKSTIAEADMSADAKKL